MIDEKEGTTGLMTAFLDEMTKVYDDMELRMFELLTYSTGGKIKYKDRKIDSLNVKPDYVCLRLRGDIGALEFLYPRLIVDQDLLALKEFLGKYRKAGWHSISGSYDEKVLGEMSVPLKGLLTKLSLMKVSIENLEESLFSLKSQDPKSVLEPLIREPLQAFKKDTSSIRDLAGRMKEHVADIDIWRNYRNSWTQLNEQLKLLGFLDFFKRSEEMMSNINSRYPTEEKLNVIDTRACREFMNEIIDRVDAYDSMLKQVK